jgi:hypothetical protein
MACFSRACPTCASHMTADQGPEPVQYPSTYNPDAASGARCKQRFNNDVFPRYAGSARTRVCYDVYGLSVNLDWQRCRESRGAHDACAARCMELATVRMLCSKVMSSSILPRPWAGWQWPTEALQKNAYMVIQDTQILQDCSIGALLAC